ncbi:hypothetical protein [Flexithrix dorotheae]|uniref:hypothetical protein n=1 Tax=Flexithrix dorotheae TaxID=70993 RepID=UPI00036C62D1|nr:hypothetical protein [Flexithrix dorotheae]
MSENNSTEKLAEEFKKVKANIRKLKDTGFYKEGIAIINEISKVSFDFDIHVAKNTPGEDLMVLLEDHRQLNYFQLNVLAELLMLEGEIYYEMKNYEDSKICHEVALKIFMHIDERDENPYSIDIMDCMTKNMEMLQRIKTEMNK